MTSDGMHEYWRSGRARLQRRKRSGIPTLKSRSQTPWNCVRGESSHNAADGHNDVPGPQTSPRGISSGMKDYWRGGRRKLTARLEPKPPTTLPDAPAKSESLDVWIKRLDRPEGVIPALTEIKSQIELLQTGYRAGLCEASVRIYIVAQHLQLSDPAWRQFCSHQCWGDQGRLRPKVDDRSEMLRHVLRVVVGFDGRAATKRVSELHTGLSPFYERQADPEEVRKALTRSGLSTLIDAARKDKAAVNNVPASAGISIKCDEVQMQRLLACAPGDKLVLSSEVGSVQGGLIVLMIDSVRKVAKA